MRMRFCGSVTVALITVLGGCAQRADVTTVGSGTGVGTVDVASVRAAPDAAVEAGSARFEMTIAIQSAEGSYDLVATGGYSGRQMSLRMDIGEALAGAAGATGETFPAGVTEPMEIVVDGDATYLRIPALAGGVGSGTWLSIDSSDLGLASSLGVGAGATDPAQLLATLRGISDDITDVGTEEVRGVTTTHLAGTIDIARALDGVTGDRALLRGQLDALGATSAGIPVDVWIDADGLVRRFAIDVSNVMPASGAAAGDAATMTLELFDYGEPFSVVVPDPSVTTSYRDVLGGVGQS